VFGLCDEIALETLDVPTKRDRMVAVASVLSLRNLGGGQTFEESLTQLSNTARCNL